jgi:hypothetical protein
MRGAPKGNVAIVSILLFSFALGTAALLWRTKGRARFNKTGSIAPAKATVRLAGTVRSYQPLVAPVSGLPCLYYEVQVERLWYQWETSENCSTRTKGTSNVLALKVGSVFSIDDGSGPVHVDMREGVKVDEQDVVTFGKTLNMVSGDARVGGFTFHVPVSLAVDEDTYAVRVTERIVELSDAMFVLGTPQSSTPELEVASLERTSSVRALETRATNIKRQHAA